MNPARTTPARGHYDEALADSEREVLRLRRELRSTRDRLEAAEFVLAHLGQNGEGLETRLQSLVDKATADVGGMRAEGRRQVQMLVAEAEELRALAREGAAAAASQARDEVVKRAGEMLEDANRLRVAADHAASQTLRSAQAKYQEAEARATDLNRAAEQAHADVFRQRSDLEQQIVAARGQAQAFLRSSRLEAEARARELTDLAHRQLADAQRQGESIVRTAEHEARRILGVVPNADPTWKPGPENASLVRPVNAASPETQVNRVDHGRKFGRPQS